MQVAQPHSGTGNAQSVSSTELLPRLVDRDNCSGSVDNRYTHWKRFQPLKCNLILQDYPCCGLWRFHRQHGFRHDGDLTSQDSRFGLLFILRISICLLSTFTGEYEWTAMESIRKQDQAVPFDNDISDAFRPIGHE